MIEALDEEPVAGDDAENSARRQRRSHGPSTGFSAEKGASRCHAEECCAPERLNVARRDVIARIARVEETERVPDYPGGENDRDFAPIGKRTLADWCGKRVGVGSAGLSPSDRLGCSPAYERADIGTKRSSHRICLRHVAGEGESERGSRQSTDERTGSLSAIARIEHVHRRPAGQRTVVTHVEAKVTLRAGDECPPGDLRCGEEGAPRHHKISRCLAGTVVSDGAGEGGPVDE